MVARCVGDGTARKPPNEDADVFAVRYDSRPINPLNIFGCYISPKHRKQHPEWAARGVVVSDLDDFTTIVDSLFRRLSRYLYVFDCNCPKDIYVYEGEIAAAGGIPTETALRNYPLDPGTSDY